jgi:hypothetical protein
LIVEKRAKETRDSPANRPEITARLPFNFVVARLGLSPRRKFVLQNLSEIFSDSEDFSR